jgi:hypothetical protein
VIFPTTPALLPCRARQLLQQRIFRQVEFLPHLLELLGPDRVGHRAEPAPEQLVEIPDDCPVRTGFGPDAPQGVPGFPFRAG